MRLNLSKKGLVFCEADIIDTVRASDELIDLMRSAEIPKDGSGKVDHDTLLDIAVHGLSDVVHDVRPDIEVIDEDELFDTASLLVVSREVDSLPEVEIPTINHPILAQLAVMALESEGIINLN